MENRVNTVLTDAEKIIYGDREKTYGHPSKNLNAIAVMWSAYLHSRGLLSSSAPDTMQPEDVAIMMVLLKAARLGNNPTHRDSLVDICGYAALVERCGETPS